MAHINITLPDGTIKNYPTNVTGSQIAADIGPGLAKAAIAMEVNGTERDLSEQIQQDSTLNFLTLKDPRGLDAARHTLTAQVLARAIKSMFPKAKLAIGPTIEHGFYYDVDFSAEKAPLSADDLPKLEQKMRDLMGEKNPVAREVLPAAEVRQIFADANETYKLEIIDNAIAKGELINGPNNEKCLSIWRQTTKNGDDFIDLCRGPHATNLSQLPKAFTLTTLAGAYWRGDSNNQQLTRIYGLAFATKDDLAAHQHMLEEARKRDHRKLGRELDLFHLQDEAPGQIFWHTKGWALYLELQNLIRTKLSAANYIEVNTPQRIHNSLYKASGHWDKFGTENMFLVDEGDDNIFAMKPMNCPCHVQIFNTGNKSYRDLPLRMAEFGSCMRNEAHGALHGLMRVTTMTQDDAHVFCTPDQIQSESLAFCQLLGDVYQTFGFTDYFVKLSDRPAQRVGSDDNWDKAEQALTDACDAAGLKWSLNPGEGAFYGPKLEFVLRDSIGRDWQCGTLQVDFNLPVRLKAEFDTESGGKESPVMLHRAILGSLERFTGILIENMEGRFPTWLAPTQVMVVPIADRHNAYAQALADKLKASITTATGGLRVEVDSSSERMQKKILLAQQQKIPYMLVVGDKEQEQGTAAVRLRNGKDLGALTTEQIIQRLQTEIQTRTDSPENAHVNKEAEVA